MAEEQRESNILATGSIDIDVSDALKGLKALRREANETIKVLDQLQERLGKLPKESDNQAVFNASGDGLTIKRGDWEVAAKNPISETVEKTIEVVDSVAMNKGIYVANNVRKLSQIVIKHITKYLEIDVEVKRKSSPRFIVKVGEKMITQDVVNNKCVIDLGKPTGKTEDVEVYATSPIANGISEFELKGIYLKN